MIRIFSVFYVKIRSTMKCCTYN